VIRTRHLDSQRGYLELLSPMYEKASPDSLLHRAVYAVGLGCLSHVEKSTPLRREARAMYGKALKNLSMAIKDPVQSTLDQTLMTILLLSLCEVRTHLVGNVRFMLNVLTANNSFANSARSLGKPRPWRSCISQAEGPKTAS
jgi:transcription factor-like protein